MGGITLNIVIVILVISLKWRFEMGFIKHERIGYMPITRNTVSPVVGKFKNANGNTYYVLHHSATDNKALLLSPSKELVVANDISGSVWGYGHYYRLAGEKEKVLRKWARMYPSFKPVFEKR